MKISRNDAKLAHSLASKALLDMTNAYLARRKRWDAIWETPRQAGKASRFLRDCHALAGDMLIAHAPTRTVGSRPLWTDMLLTPNVARTKLAVAAQTFRKGYMGAPLILITFRMHALARMMQRTVGSNDWPMVRSLLLQITALTINELPDNAVGDITACLPEGAMKGHRTAAGEPVEYATWISSSNAASPQIRKGETKIFWEGVDTL